MWAQSTNISQTFETLDWSLFIFFVLKGHRHPFCLPFDFWPAVCTVYERFFFYIIILLFLSHVGCCCFVNKFSTFFVHKLQEAFFCLFTFIRPFLLLRIIRIIIWLFLFLFVILFIFLYCRCCDGETIAKSRQNGRRASKREWTLTGGNVQSTSRKDPKRLSVGHDFCFSSSCAICLFFSRCWCCFCCCLV